MFGFVQTNKVFYFTISVIFCGKYRHIFINFATSFWSHIKSLKRVYCKQTSNYSTRNYTSNRIIVYYFLYEPHRSMFGIKCDSKFCIHFTCANSFSMSPHNFRLLNGCDLFAFSIENNCVHFSLNCQKIMWLFWLAYCPFQKFWENVATSWPLWIISTSFLLHANPISFRIGWCGRFEYNLRQGHWLRPGALRKLFDATNSYYVIFYDMRRQIYFHTHTKMWCSEPKPNLALK